MYYRAPTLQSLNSHKIFTAVPKTVHPKIRKSIAYQNGAQKIPKYFKYSWYGHRIIS